jgi:hypothetical protein
MIELTLSLPIKAAKNEDQGLVLVVLIVFLLDENINW